MLRPELLTPARKIAGTIGACLSPQVRIDGSQVLCIVARCLSEKRLTSQGLDMPAALGATTLSAAKSVSPRCSSSSLSSSTQAARWRSMIGSRRRAWRAMHGAVGGHQVEDARVVGSL